jgi:hypothetical protein
MKKLRKLDDVDRPVTKIEIGAKKRASVLRDFEKVAGPLRGQNQDRKPKA